MALVNLTDRPAETLTDWEDGLEITAQSLVLVPISAIDDARDTVISAGARLGLLVDTSVTFDELEKSLDAVSFVQIDFPAFGDGRGFSLAVRLRKDKGFTGEIRAGGHLIPDQAQFLVRAGFDTVHTTDDRLSAFETAKTRFAVYYQADMLGGQSVAHLRHSSEETRQAS